MGIKPVYCSTALTDYCPLPRSLLNAGLSSTALLTYAVLLDRATLSQKNGFTDENGWVFVIYPVEHQSDGDGSTKESDTWFGNQVSLS